MKKKSIIVSLVFILIVTGIAAAQDSAFVYPVPVFGQGTSGSSYQIIPVQPTAVPQIRPYPQGQQQQYQQGRQPQHQEWQLYPPNPQPQYPQGGQPQQHREWQLYPPNPQPQYPQGGQPQQYQEWQQYPPNPQNDISKDIQLYPQKPQSESPQEVKTSDGVQTELKKKKDGTFDLTWTVTNKTEKIWDEDAVDILCSKGTELLSKSTKRWDLPKTIKANKPLTWTVNIRAPKRNESMEFCLMDGGVQLYCFTVVPR